MKRHHKPRRLRRGLRHEATFSQPLSGTIVPFAPPGTKPVANVWPMQSECIKFYGDPRTAGWLNANTVSVKSPWPMHCGSIPVDHILIHKKCADSLARVLSAVWDAVDHDLAKIKALKYDVYDGSYNLRSKRGSGSLSMHAFAAAIDFDAADNPFHSTHHLFTGDSPLVKAFKAEGWVWGGDWSPGSQDGMHFQAARVHA